MINGPVKVYFPGYFNPPSGMHLNVLLWLLQNPSAYKIVVVIGKSPENDLPGYVKSQILQNYLNLLNISKIDIEMSESRSPLTHIYELQEQKNNERFYVALNETEAKSDLFNKYFSHFANCEVQIIPSYIDEDSPKMIEAVRNNDFVEFMTLIPAELSIESKRNCFDLIKNNLPSVEKDNDEIDPVEDKSIFEHSYWAKKLIKKI